LMGAFFSVLLRPSYSRVGDRDLYRAKRTSQNDDGNLNLFFPGYDEKQYFSIDTGRSGHGGDYHHKREFSGGRQYEDEGRRRSDDHARRGGGGGSSGGGHDRERYGGPS
ncbi:unnamed protein product, partial [Rotaria socialis]